MIHLKFYQKYDLLSSKHKPSIADKITFTRQVFSQKFHHRRFTGL